MTYACQFKTPLIVVAAVSALVFVSKRTDFFTIICSKITKSFNSAFEKNKLDESDQTDVVELEDTMPTIIVSNSAPSLPSKNQIQNGASNGIDSVSSELPEVHEENGFLNNNVENGNGDTKSSVDSTSSDELAHNGECSRWSTTESQSPTDAVEDNKVNNNVDSGNGYRKSPAELIQTTSSDENGNGDIKSAADSIQTTSSDENGNGDIKSAADSNQTTSSDENGNGDTKSPADSNQTTSSDELVLNGESSRWSTTESQSPTIAVEDIKVNNNVENGNGDTKSAADSIQTTSSDENGNGDTKSAADSNQTTSSDELAHNGECSRLSTTESQSPTIAVEDIKVQSFESNANTKPNTNAVAVAVAAAVAVAGVDAIDNIIDSNLSSSLSNLQIENGVNRTEPGEVVNNVPNVQTEVVQPRKKVVKKMVQFFIPQDLVGRLIGRGGTSVNTIKSKTNANISIQEEPILLNTKLCSVFGTDKEIEDALIMIRKRFPIARYPELTLIPMREYLERPQLSYDLFLFFRLVENNYASVKCIVNAGHLFFHLHYHPSYHSADLLREAINKHYMAESPMLENPVEGTVCVGLIEGSWERCLIVQIMDGGQCEIKLLDLGGYMTISIVLLRQIHVSFLSVPFQAIEAYMYNIKPANNELLWSLDALNIVKSNTDDHEAIVHVAGFHTDNVPLVNVYSIIKETQKYIFLNQLLVEKGCADWIDPNNCC